MTEVDILMRQGAIDKAAGEHSVRHIVRGGDYVRTEFRCTAPPDARCRTFCQRCIDDSEEQCLCGYYDREPVETTGHPCNYLAWMESAPEESYDGPDTPARGPGWQPVTFEWQGDFYTWRYRDE